MFLALTNPALASLLDLEYARAMKPVAALYLTLSLAAGLTACRAQSSPDSSAKITPPSTPMRIVSLDFCADQYVLKLIEPEHILALSPDAGKPISYLKGKAQNIPSVRPNAEDVLQLKPDLIIRSYGGGPNADSFYRRAGLPVVNIGWAGDFGGIKSVTQQVADGLGQTQRGAAIITDLDTRLAAIKPPKTKPRALYMTPSGTTAGAGSLIDEVFIEAGLENFQTQAGWRDIPLERLAYEQPDLIAAAFFDTNTENAWSAMRHPIARAQIQNQPTTPLKGSWMSCGAWFAMDAVEALAQSSGTAVKPKP